MIAYALSALLGAFLMFGLPALAAVLYGPARAWNARRLARARRYRAQHGTPWWVVESERAERQRRWLDGEVDRAAGIPRPRREWT